MNANFIRERITELRIQKNVSEHRMSLDLGHARSYIHGIVSGKTLPSMAEFLAICEYFNITPENFFKQNNPYGVQLTRLTQLGEKLSDHDLNLLIDLAERLSQTPP